MKTAYNVSHRNRSLSTPPRPYLVLRPLFLYFFILCIFSNFYSRAQYTKIPDKIFEQALIDHRYDDILDGKVLSNNILNVKTLNIDGKGIVNLDGIGDFTKLEYLYCSGISVLSLDLSKNTNLKTLVCKNIGLKQLNVSKNVDLISLNCSINKIEELDLTKNTLLENLNIDHNNFDSINFNKNINLKTFSCNFNNIKTLSFTKNKHLKSLDCSNNILVGINLRNGNNANIEEIKAKNNPNLTCVWVDNPTTFSQKWSIKFDAGIKFGNVSECSVFTKKTNVPDANFEEELRRQGLDGTGDTNDQYVHTYLIDNVKTLYVNGKGIKNLKGIEDFKNLVYLSATYNEISKLDFSKNTKLGQLYVQINSTLSELNVSNNIELTELGCAWTKIANLYLGNNTALDFLYVNNTNIRVLDLSNNIKIKELHSSRTKIKELDLSNNIYLSKLFCRGNQNLDKLILKNGSFSEIDADNNIKLTCVVVDNPNTFKSKWSDKFDPEVKFVRYLRNCNSSDIIVVSNRSQKIVFVIINKALLPNESIKSVEILDSYGRLIHTFGSQKSNEYDFSSSTNIRLPYLYGRVVIVKVSTTANRTLAKRVLL